jgi:CRISPR-associated protein Cas8b1/Cst1 subtype I-B
MLKQINKDNLLKTNGIDVNKYNSDRVYKMIKKNKLPYNSLNKESILQMIINYERNSKANKAEALLNKKTHRKRTRPKEPVSSERIGKRYAGQNEENYEEIYAAGEPLKFGDRSKKNKREEGLAPSSLYATNINTRSRRLSTKSEIFGNLSGQNIPVGSNIGYRTTQSNLVEFINF